MPLRSPVPSLSALELLLSVGALGSLGQAAAAHKISQPAASLRIRQLERQLGVLLLDRSPQGSTLTTSGAVVADWAQGVVEAAQTLQVGVAAMREHVEGQLRVMASLTIAEYLMPGWLIALQSHQQVSVALQVGNSRDVISRVESGEVDLGFIEQPDRPRALRSASVGTDRLVVVASRLHPWAAKRAPVSAADLAVTPLVLREPGSGTRETFDQVMVTHGGHATPVMELASTTAIKSALISGVAPGVVSVLAVQSELQDGRLMSITVEGLDLRRVLRAVWRPGHDPVGSAVDLIAIAQQRRPLIKRSQQRQR